MNDLADQIGHIEAGSLRQLLALKLKPLPHFLIFTACTQGKHLIDGNAYENCDQPAVFN